MTPLIPLVYLFEKNCAHTFIVYDKQNFFRVHFLYERKTDLGTGACLSG